MKTPRRRRLAVRSRKNRLTELLGEARIVAQLGCPNQVRLQTVTLPDTPNGLLAHSGHSRHCSGTPVCGASRLLLSRLSHDRPDLRCGQRWLSTRARRVVGQPFQALFEETPPPEIHDSRNDPSSSAICLFCFPSAASRTIRARRTSRAAVRRPRLHTRSCCLCSSTRTTGGATRIDDDLRHRKPVHRHIHSLTSAASL